GGLLPRHFLNRFAGGAHEGGLWLCRLDRLWAAVLLKQASAELITKRVVSHRIVALAVGAASAGPQRVEAGLRRRETCRLVGDNAAYGGENVLHRRFLPPCGLRHWSSSPFPNLPDSRSRIESATEKDTRVERVWHVEDERNQGRLSHFPSGMRTPPQASRTC